MDWIDLGVSLCYVVLGAVILIIAKFVNDLLTPYPLDRELTVRDNPAIGLSLSGYYLGSSSSSSELPRDRGAAS